MLPVKKANSKNIIIITTVPVTLLGGVVIPLVVWIVRSTNDVGTKEIEFTRDTSIIESVDPAKDNSSGNKTDATKSQKPLNQHLEELLSKDPQTSEHKKAHYDLLADFFQANEENEVVLQAASKLKVLNETTRLVKLSISRMLPKIGESILLL